MPKKRSLDSVAQKCSHCLGACCRYITASITAPRSMLDFDNLIWQLYHENVRALKDSDGWSLLIYNKCMNLGPDGRCTIYPQRPIACRVHPEEICEYDDPLHENADLYFGDPQTLIAYCKKRFRNWDKRFKGYDE
ncbi:MAG: YkgJ family cysteine cluster protein [Chitinispirillaceae bacterium]|nr:YkgJ family cysteine cluster protein [Chitinispirillaceae bacterium]